MARTYVKFELKRLSKTAKIPKYAHEGDAGMDLYSAVDITIKAESTALVDTGIAIGLPEGYEAQVRSRSGLALRSGISVLNAPGTIDEGYVGEIGVILHNHGHYPFDVHIGDRIAQLVIAPVTRGVPIIVDELKTTDRGSDGFGSTGTK